MTYKKYRVKLAKKYRRIGYPWREAWYLARHGRLPLDWHWIDDMTIGRDTYYNENTNQIMHVYRGADYNVDEILIFEKTKPLHCYYD